MFLLVGDSFVYGQTTILNTPGPVTYTNSDGPTGPDVYSVDVSGCTSIEFSFNFAFSLPWEGGGNMEFCDETQPGGGGLVCFTTGSPCGCDPTDPQAGSCSGCWDFLWARFNLDGNNVGSELIGGSGTTDADQFGNRSSGCLLYTSDAADE